MLKFFAEKMWVAFAVQKLLTFFQQKISEYCILNLLKQLTKWPLTSSLSLRRFEQLGPVYQTYNFCRSLAYSQPLESILEILLNDSVLEKKKGIVFTLN